MPIPPKRYKRSITLSLDSDIVDWLIETAKADGATPSHGTNCLLRLVKNKCVKGITYGETPDENA